MMTITGNHPGLSRCLSESFPELFKEVWIPPILQVGGAKAHRDGAAGSASKFLLIKTLNEKPPLHEVTPTKTQFPNKGTFASTRVGVGVQTSTHLSGIHNSAHTTQGKRGSASSPSHAEQQHNPRTSVAATATAT